MTETPETSADAAPKGGQGGLSAKLMPELRQIASGLGVRTAGLKKADLVSAIRAAQSGGAQGGAQGSNDQGGQPRPERAREEQPRQEHPREDRPREDSGGTDASGEQGGGRRTRNRGRQQDGQQDGQQGGQQEARQGGQQGGQQEARQESGQDDEPAAAQQTGEQESGQQEGKRQGRRGKGQQEKGQQEKGQQEKGQQEKSGRNQRGNQGQGGNESQGKQNQNGNNQANNQSANQGSNQNGEDDDDEQGGRRNRRRRGRDRTQRTTGGRSEPDTTILEDDVLTPCAGILDVLDNYAFVRTSGYLPGADDVYVSLSMVRKYGLRRGDAITGQVRQPREGERREKFNPLVQIDSVNGADPESAQDRVEFADLVALYPDTRLRLETGPTGLVGRVIDLAAPVGKGQRGLIVAPPRSGKTTVLQQIAAAVSANNPECHLMVVLVDERPEEVTDFQRTVKGEVISSTFDRQPSDHTTVAELAIERAKRLVELGHDVVVLLDGLTRLGRAYNLAAPASGRTLSGGVDSSALHPPKRFFGAARNIENGGSLTILATAQVETGSATDEVIFEELGGTGNWELRLSRDLAEHGVFPAVDAVRSGTRREELLLGKEELAIVWRLRRALAEMEDRQAAELLAQRLRATQTNYEFLVSVQQRTPTVDDLG